MTDFNPKRSLRLRRSAGPPNVKTAYSRRGGRADRARNQSELMRASRRMISGSYLLARIRTWWDFREPQVTVSQTCFRAPEICCRSDTVQQKSVSAFEPSSQSHATARGSSHFNHGSKGTTVNRGRWMKAGRGNMAAPAKRID